MQSIDVNVAGPRFSELLKVVESGEIVVITSNGQPVVRLEPMVVATRGEMLNGVSIDPEMSVHLDGEIEALFNSLK